MGPGQLAERNFFFFAKKYLFVKIKTKGGPTA
jgi:hypothetical protein